MARAPVWLWGLGGGAAVLAAGIAAWLALRGEGAAPVALAPPADGPTAAPPIPVAPPDATAEARPEARSEAPPADPAPAAPPAAPAVAPPGFDVVRVATDGAALVAGRAAPGAEVVLRVDEGVVARTLADPSGQFVAMFELGASAVPQVLTLSAGLADGTVLAAPDVVVLAPREGPAAVAEAPAADAPAPAAAPVAEAAAPVVEMAAAGSASAPAPVEIAAATPEPTPVPAPEPTPEPAPEPVPEPVAEAAPAAPPEAAPEAASQPAPPPQAVAAEAAAPPVELTAVAEPDPAPPAAFVVEAGGGVRLLDRAPQVLDNVVVDAIGYGPEGDVQISGRTRQIESGTPLRVYLNNEPVALARSEGADWRLDLPQVDPGVYTLRVDELAPDGRVVSRFETPFLREDPAAVARLFGTAPPAPAEGETGAQAEPAPGPPAALRPQTEAPAEPSTPAPAAAGAPASGPSPEPAAEPAPEPARPVAVAAAPEATPSTAPPAPRVMLVTVQPGHTLWRLSREHYGEGTRYLQIYRANRAQIRDPDLIYPGQIFAIPD